MLNCGEQKGVLGGGGGRGPHPYLRIFELATLRCYRVLRCSADDDAVHGSCFHVSLRVITLLV